GRPLMLRIDTVTGNIAHARRAAACSRRRLEPRSKRAAPIGVEARLARTVRHEVPVSCRHAAPAGCRGRVQAHGSPGSRSADLVPFW
ncbi:MAG: hypothetical protein ACREX8_12545, partial [Gammaproteobacteria bacterium]